MENVKKTAKSDDISYIGENMVFFPKIKGGFRPGMINPHEYHAVGFVMGKNVFDIKNEKKVLPITIRYACSSRNNGFYGATRLLTDDHVHVGYAVPREWESIEYFNLAGRFVGEIIEEHNSKFGQHLPGSEYPFVDKKGVKVFMEAYPRIVRHPKVNLGINVSGEGVNARIKEVRRIIIKEPHKIGLKALGFNSDEVVCSIGGESFKLSDTEIILEMTRSEREKASNRGGKMRTFCLKTLKDENGEPVAQLGFDGKTVILTCLWCAEGTFGEIASEYIAGHNIFNEGISFTGPDGRTVSYVPENNGWGLDITSMGHTS